MTALLGLAPYAAFFLLQRLGSTEAGLWAAAAVGLGVTGLRLRAGGRVTLLQGGPLVLFAVLAAATSVAQLVWTTTGLRLAMNVGFLALVLGSLAVGRPFTLAYARRRVPPSFWQAPLFLAVNRAITWAWAGAFALLTADTVADLMFPRIPGWADALANVLVMAGAVLFTMRYPGFARRRAGLQPVAFPPVAPTQGGELADKVREVLAPSRDILGGPG